MTEPTAPLPPVEPAVQPPVEAPVASPQYATATTIAPPPPPYAGEPVVAAPAPQPRGGRTGLVVVASVAAGLLLLGAGFGLGRLTAPSGPASLIDAVRMAQQGQLPCGTAPQGAGGGAGLLGRMCQVRPGQGGGFGPGQGGQRGNGNGNNGGGGNGNGNNGSVPG